MFQIVPPSGCQNANNAINARLDNRTYVLRSAGTGTIRVQARLNHGRAITLCCTAKMPSSAVFTAIVGTMGAKFVFELMHTDQVSPDLELPSWLVYACIPLGSYLMCFRFLQVMWTYYRTNELPHHDAAHVDDIEVSAKAPIALGEA